MEDAIVLMSGLEQILLDFILNTFFQSVSQMQASLYSGKLACCLGIMYRENYYVDTRYELKFIRFVT